MAWVVDTCVLLDVLEDDVEFGRPSALLLKKKLARGLVISPITYVELSPVFNGSRDLQDKFLRGVGSDFHQNWTREDTERAHQVWHSYVGKRRQRLVGKRPIADILIGAFAMRFEGLITRNSDDFVLHFPSLALAVPEQKRRE